MAQFIDANINVPDGSVTTTPFGGVGYNWQRALMFGGTSEFSEIRMRGPIYDKNGNEILAGGGGSGAPATSVIWQASGTVAPGYVIGDSATLLAYLVANPTVNNVYCNDQNGTAPLQIDTVLNLNITGASAPYVCLSGFDANVAEATTPCQVQIVGSGQIINPYKLSQLYIFSSSNLSSLLVYDTTVTPVMAVYLDSVSFSSPQSPPFISCNDGGTVIMFYNNTLLPGNSTSEGNAIAAGTTNLVVICSGVGGISVSTDAFAFSNNSGNIQVLTDSVLQVPLVAQSAVTGEYTVRGPEALFESADDPNNYVGSSAAYPSIGPTVQDFLNKLSTITPDSIIWAANGFIGDNNYIVGTSDVVNTYLSNNPDTKIIYVDDSMGALQMTSYINVQSKVRFIGLRDSSISGQYPTINFYGGFNLTDPLGLECITIQNSQPINNGTCIFYNSVAFGFAYQRNVNYIYNTPNSCPFMYTNGTSINPYTLVLDNVNIPTIIPGGYPYSIHAFSTALTVLVTNNSVLGSASAINFFGNASPDVNSTVSVMADSSSIIPLVNQTQYTGSSTYTVNGGQAWQVSVKDPNSYLLPLDVTYASIGASVQDMLNKLTANVYHSGTATLSSGTIIVTTPNVHASSSIVVSYNTISAVSPGILSVPASGRTGGVSFTINSTGTMDNSTVDWIIGNFVA